MQMKINEVYVITHKWFENQECSEISNALPAFKEGALVKVLETEMYGRLATKVSIGNTIYTSECIGGCSFDGMLSAEDVKHGRITKFTQIGDPNPYPRHYGEDFKQQPPALFLEILEELKNIRKLLEEKL